MVFVDGVYIYSSDFLFRTCSRTTHPSVPRRILKQDFSLVFVFVPFKLQQVMRL